MHRSVQSLLTPVLLILLAGCSALEFAQKVPERDDEIETAPADETRQCDWREVRGVAELIAVRNSEGTFLFYPGEQKIRTQVEEGWEEGQEFTAILQQPEPEDCANPKLRIVKPLAPGP